VKLVCATRNKGKIREFQRLFAGLSVEILSLSDVGFEDEIEETGGSFEENAYIKAKTVCDFSGLPAFADDSGLEVDMLGGEPGIYSARYGGEGLDDYGRNKLLLEKMIHVSYDLRTAHFVCAICLCMPEPDEREIRIRQRCDGVIGYEPKGVNGFGYDPLFVYNGKSFGEMSDWEKDRISHRGKAVSEFLIQFQEKILED